MKIPKNKPKVLVIGTTEKTGGAARVGWNIGSGLSKKYDVKYLVGYKHSKSNRVSELPINSILGSLDKKFKKNISSTFRHLFAFISANNIDTGHKQAILKHPWYRDADIIHCHNLHGNFFKLETLIDISKEKKLVWTLHDMSAITSKCAYTQDPNIWKDGYQPCKQLKSYPPMLWDNTHYLWNKKKQIYNKCNKMHIVVPSHWLENIVKKSILQDHILHYIPNGIDTELFHPKNKKVARKKLSLPLNKKIILYIAHGGKTDPRKGWNYIEGWINNQKDSSNLIICIGGGKTIQSSDNVLYIPHLESDRKLAEYYTAADVLAMTSVAENAPLVVLEAMACGLPIVGFDSTGITELIRHKKTGYLANFGSNIDFANGVKYLLDLSDNRYQQMSKNSRQAAVKQFSLQLMVSRYDKLYSSI